MAVNGADGCVERGVIASDGCCPDTICSIDPVVLACSYVNLLPSGPLWDRPKRAAVDFYNTTKEPGSYFQSEDDCTSMVGYAVYTSRILFDLLQNALWPSLRESDPATAVTTQDDWLDRLGWQDCFATQCRSVLLGTLTPYEIMGECGPIFCPVETPPALAAAVKRGIILALIRSQMAQIKTLCALNWIIEPLGAVLTPRIDETLECCDGSRVTFDISNASDVLPAVQDDLSPCGTPSNATVPASIYLNICDRPAGMPEVIWPGIVAAECIVRSLLPTTCPTQIFRAC